MNLQEIQNKISENESFEYYSLQFGSVGGLDCVKIVSVIDYNLVDLKLSIEMALRYYSVDEIVINGDGESVIVSVTPDFIAAMNPSEFLKSTLGEDLCHGKSVHKLMKDYSDYVVEVNKRLERYVKL